MMANEDFFSGLDASVPSSGGGAASSLGLTDYTSAASGVIGGLGDAFSSYEAGQGAKSEASADRQAAALAGTDILYEKENVTLQQTAQQRQLAKTQGKAAAAIAGSGFTTDSGSAYDIFSENAQQGALAHGVMGMQGLITESGYAAQQQAYLAKATAADTAASAADAGVMGGVLKGAMAVAPLLLAL
jgi:hypothetical protein